VSNCNLTNGRIIVDYKKELHNILKTSKNMLYELGEEVAVANKMLPRYTSAAWTKEPDNVACDIEHVKDTLTKVGQKMAWLEYHMAVFESDVVGGPIR